MPPVHRCRLRPLAPITTGFFNYRAAGWSSEFECAPEYNHWIVLFHPSHSTGSSFLLLRGGRSGPKHFDWQTYHPSKRAVSDDHGNEVKCLTSSGASPGRRTPPVLTPVSTHDAIPPPDNSPAEVQGSLPSPPRRSGIFGDNSKLPRRHPQIPRLYLSHRASNQLAETPDVSYSSQQRTKRQSLSHTYHGYRCLHKCPQT